MKKLIIFGATGATGKEVVRQSLGEGFDVTVIVRDPSSLHSGDPDLKIVQGDVLRPETFSEEIIGKDAVISCLGIGSGTKPTVVYSEGVRNILTAMEKADVTRLICISAGALYTNKNMGFIIRTLTRLVLQKIFRNPYADMRIMEKILERSSIDWTVLRPPMLRNGPLTKKFRVAIGSDIKNPFSISRADLAWYMVSIISAAETFKTKIGIAY
jgi:putative NADH-flavin reductase